MKCPDCDSELPSRQCEQCGEKTPVFGKFCCFCGVELVEPEVEEHDENPTDFSERTLCGDGACIGVINEQGTCGECGKPYAE